MNSDYIDIHGHVDFPDFDEDRVAVISRARQAVVSMITVGTDVATSAKALELAIANEGMWAIVGVHPADSDLKKPIDFEALESMAQHPKAVAIGECGLDYFHSKPEDVPLQREVFIRHIELANKVGKPLMLHVRNGKNVGSVSVIGNAYQDALNLLKKHAKVRASFHFFAGSTQDLEDIIAAGYGVSFTGVITFTKDYDELVRSAPLSRIMSETDCPFVAPAPHRGTRNEPAYVVEVVKAIARIRAEDEGVVAKQLVKNAKEFFGI